MKSCNFPLLAGKPIFFLRFLRNGSQLCLTNLLTFSSVLNFSPESKPQQWRNMGLSRHFKAMALRQSEKRKCLYLPSRQDKSWSAADWRRKGAEVDFYAVVDINARARAP